MEKTKNIAFLGTGSDVGKSVVATAYCRILKQHGISVAPFKAQNMSNNSYVSLEGGEIGRAQAAQAEAAGLLPSIHMNPVLLKPCSEKGAQVIVQGRVHGNMMAGEYYRYKREIKSCVMDSYDTLATQYEAIVIEGAGSCCEVNLRENDIVNFDMALSANSPVVLVADIERGGVFAQIIGSLELISEEERNLVAGFIINKFRGDSALFDSGVDFIEKQTGKPVLGVVPYYRGFSIDLEDSLSLDTYKSRKQSKYRSIEIAAVRLPHISNFTDLDALAQDGDVVVNWLDSPSRLDGFHAVIIPGSKSVINDMMWLERTGWKIALADYARNLRGVIAGICGGYQMLGHRITDPNGIEGDITEINGLGLLDVTTEIEPVKTVRLSTGCDYIFGKQVRGYEIHMGATAIGRKVNPFMNIAGNHEGAMTPDGGVFGSYLHGLFDSGEFRKCFLTSVARHAGQTFDESIPRRDYWEVKNENYDRLAAHFEKYTDAKSVMEIMGWR